MNADNSMNLDLIRQKMSEHIKDEETKTKGLKIVDMCSAEGKDFFTFLFFIPYSISKVIISNICIFCRNRQFKIHIAH